MGGDRKDDPFDVGRLLSQMSTLEKQVSLKVASLELKVASIEKDQQAQSATLREIQAEQSLQGQILERVDKAAQEWAAIKPMRARIGIVVWALAIAIPGYAVAFGVQYANYASMSATVKKLDRASDSDDESSPAAKQKKWQVETTQAINSLTSESRAWRGVQTERIDNINQRTQNIEKALIKRRLIRGAP